ADAAQSARQRAVADRADARRDALRPAVARARRRETGAAAAAAAGRHRRTQGRGAATPAATASAQAVHRGSDSCGEALVGDRQGEGGAEVADQRRAAEPAASPRKDRTTW